MQGSVVIDFEKGWACSNEATMLVERELVTIDGKKYSKHTSTIRAFSFFNVEGEMAKEDVGEAVFKMDESGTQKGFKVKVVGLTEEMAILEVLEDIENYKVITKKIKRRI